jgi:hypothetical protein
MRHTFDESALPKLAFISRLARATASASVWNGAALNWRFMMRSERGETELARSCA